MAVRMRSGFSLLPAQVSTKLSQSQQDSIPQSPDEVLCLVAPFNRLGDGLLSSGLEQYSLLCMLGLQNNNLTCLDPQVKAIGIAVASSLRYETCVRLALLSLQWSQVLPRSLMYLNVAGNKLSSLAGITLPNLLWLDASDNLIEVRQAQGWVISKNAEGEILL